MSSNQNVRLIDIAMRLDLTVNTVSRALRDKSDIGFETKMLVKRTADEMGYIPNSIASSLRNGSSRTIAIIFDNLMNPYFMIMADKIHKRLDPLGYATMIFAGMDGRFEIESLAPIVSRKVDGIITFLEPSNEVLNIVEKNQIPIVLVGRKNTKLSIDSVSTDDFRGGYEIGKLFHSKNAKNVGYLGAPLGVECSKRRLNGLKQSLKDYNMSIKVENFRYVASNSVREDLQILLDNHVDAIFCFNDMMALEAITILKDKGLHVPQDIMLAGFDDLQNDLILPVRLTTIASDKDLIIDTTISMLLHRLDSSVEHHETRFIDYDIVLINGETT